MNSTKTRILLCSSSMDGGGSEKQLLYLLQNLPRDRFDIHLYLLYQTGSLLPEVPNDVKIASYWANREFPKFNWPGRIHRSQVKHLEDYITSQEIEVVYDRLYHMTLITGPATKGARVGRASTIVSPPSKDLVRNEKRWLRQKKARLSRAYRSADALLCVDTKTADDASRFYGIDRDRFQVLKSPLDIDKIDQIPALDASEQGWETDRKHIVSVGRLSEEKGHRYLIQAVRRYLDTQDRLSLPEIKLHIVGDGVLRKELESLTSSLELQDAVTFHGQQANPITLVKSSDLFVLPSLYEGFPNAILEAMACEKPIITTKGAAGVATLFDSLNVGSIVSAGNVEELTQAVIEHFQNPVELEQTTAVARRYVLEHHALTDWILQLSNLLESIKSKPRQTTT